MKNTTIISGIALVGVVVWAAVSLGGFSNTLSSTASTTQLSATIVPFTPLAEGTHSKVATRVNYFITSAADFQKLWTMVDATGTPPAVDFTTHAVLAVFAGKQSTTGYGIKVSKVLDSDTRLVSVIIEKPDSTCKAKASVTMPYELVVVPITSLPLEHEDVSTTITCP